MSVRIDGIGRRHGGGRDRHGPATRPRSRCSRFPYETSNRDSPCPGPGGRALHAGGGRPRRVGGPGQAGHRLRRPERRHPAGPPLPGAQDQASPRGTCSYDQISRGGKGLAVQDALPERPRTSRARTCAWPATGRLVQPGCAARRLPSVSEFRTDFRAFRKRYPWIKKFSTWNEGNFPQAQPTGRNPKRAASSTTDVARSARAAGAACSRVTSGPTPPEVRQHVDQDVPQVRHRAAAAVLGPDHLPRHG